MRRRPLVTAVFLLLAGCAKLSSFFAPPDLELDVDGPVFQDFSPAEGLPGPFNITTAGFRVVDLPGSNGVVPSGVDPNSLSVLRGSTPIPFTRSGEQVTVDLSSELDGIVVLNLAAKDLVGNASSGVISLVLDRTSPQASFTSTPASTWQSNSFSEQFRYSGTVMDPHLWRSFGALYRAGTDGVCRVDQNLLWPVGEGVGGRVDQNTWTYVVGPGGGFMVNFTAWNSAPSGGGPVTDRYCLRVTAEDRATDVHGAPNPNVTTIFHQSSLNWNPVPAVHNVTVSPPSSTIFTGQTRQLTATVNADPGLATTVDWSATPATVGSVNASGLVTSVGPGTLNVQACATAAPGVCGQATVTVQNPTVRSITVTPNNINLTHPATQQMTAAVEADPGASTSVIWSASPATVGTINPTTGLVTTVGPGILDILACSAFAQAVCGAAILTIQQNPFNFLVNLTLISWIHVAFGGGLSNTCVQGGALAASNLLSGPGSASALAGSPYTISWSGPGIVPPSTRSGTLDANGQFFDRQAISSFGTYTVSVSVTSGGVTRTASGTTMVDSGAGSCPSP